MGVLQNPPHSVQVTTRKKVAGKYGTELVPDRTFTVHGSMQPISTEEAHARGVSTDTTYRFICREWPGGPYSEVFVMVGPPGTTGTNFDQHGDARGYSTGSRLTHRQDVILKKQGTEAK